MPAERLSDLYRPFLWLAIFAFFAGFSTYLVIGLGGRTVAASAQQAEVYGVYEPAAERSAKPPPPTDPWTFEKKI